MTNLIGKTVIGNDGFSKRKGRVIGEENPKYGFRSWVIEWEDGTLDTHSKHTLKHESEHVGIGVCYTDDVQEEVKPKLQVPIYFENNVSYIQ